MTDPANFDSCARDYDALLNESLSATGESKDYFARGRLTWLRDLLGRTGLEPRCVIDFGCGTGTSIPLIFEILKAERVIGLDISQKSLEEAKSLVGSRRVELATPDEFRGSGTADLVFCNGVFHHVPPEERRGVIGGILRYLRPGGLFSLWENNPWNPGTRYIMAHSPLDRHAVMLSPRQARRILQSEGFEVLRTDALFLFPHALAWLRWLEPYLAPLPLGGQYQVLARRPSR